MERTIRAVVIVIFVSLCATYADAQPRVSRILKSRVAAGRPSSQVIVLRNDDATDDEAAEQIRVGGGTVKRQLPIIHGFVATMPLAAIDGLSHNPHFKQLSYDRLIQSANERTGATVGVTAIRAVDGYDGSGVGVAVIDSGANMWHDDLAAGGPRVVRFVDFVNGGAAAYDDYGH